MVAERRAMRRRYRGYIAKHLEWLFREINLLYRVKKIRGTFRLDPSWFPDAVRVEESGPNSPFFDHVRNPIVDRYAWFRGYWLAHNENNTAGLTLYLPWFWPQETRTPLVMIFGDPPHEWIDRILHALTQKLFDWTAQQTSERRRLPAPR